MDTPIKAIAGNGTVDKTVEYVIVDNDHVKIGGYAGSYDCAALDTAVVLPTGEWKVTWPMDAHAPVVVAP